MSAVLQPPAGAAAPAASAAAPMSPNQRAWARFKRNRIGHVSLWIMAVLLVLASGAELLSNDRPIVAHIDGMADMDKVTASIERILGS